MDATELSAEFANSVLPVTVIIGILAVFGIFGNACVIYVYKWKYSPCNFRTFVLCLALIDFTSCLFVFPTEMYGHRIWFSYPKSAAWFCKLKTSIYAVAVFTSSYVLLLISIDRFRKVCRPLGWQIKQKVARGLCLFIFGLSMILIIPCPILFGIQTSNITYSGHSILVSSCSRDDRYKDSIWITIYVGVVYYVCVITFMVTTMVLYGKILRTLFCGEFLKEIDYTEELKRKSRMMMKAEEVSGDETSEGFSIFSSDTFQDASSTWNDHSDITSEPQLTLMKSDDGLQTFAKENLETEQSKGFINKAIQEDSQPEFTATQVEPVASKADTEAPVDMRSINCSLNNESKAQLQIKNSDLPKNNETATGSDEETSQMTTDTENKSNQIGTKTELQIESDCAYKDYIRVETEFQSNQIRSDIETNTIHTESIIEVEENTPNFKNDLKFQDSNVGKMTTTQTTELQGIDELHSDKVMPDTKQQILHIQIASGIDTEIELQISSESDTKDDENIADTEPRTPAELQTVHKQNTVHFDIKDERTSKVRSTIRKRSKKKHTRSSSKQRIKSKSLVMFVVTLIFNITTFIYFCIFTVVIRKAHIFEMVTTDTAGIVFFLWRLYFINHVINPVVYGFLDPKFKQVVRRIWRRLLKKRKQFSFRH